MALLEHGLILINISYIYIEYIHTLYMCQDFLMVLVWIVDVA